MKLTSVVGDVDMAFLQCREQQNMAHKVPWRQHDFRTTVTTVRVTRNFFNCALQFRLSHSFAPHSSLSPFFTPIHTTLLVSTKSTQGRLSMPVKVISSSEEYQNFLTSAPSTKLVSRTHSKILLKSSTVVMKSETLVFSSILALIPSLSLSTCSSRLWWTLLL